MKLFKRIARAVLITAFWIAVWWLASWRVGKPLLFPSPAAVLERLIELMQTKAFYQITATSLWNVLVGILLALVLGCALAIATHKLKLLHQLLFPLMTLIKATPVASFIILALIWIGSAKVPTFITLLIVLPIVWSNLDTGLEKIDPQLIQVTKVYKMPFIRRLRLLILPSVKPYFVSACRTSLGLAWKAGIAAEIIARPRNSIGTMIGDAKQYIMTEDMFAWTLTVILLSLVIELLFTALLNKLFATRQGKEALSC